MSISPQRRVALTTMAYRGYRARLGILTGISPFRSARRVIKAYRAIRVGLAPIEMAWEGKSVGDVCRQIKDPARNGGRNLALLRDHVANDDLVGWGGSREPDGNRRPERRSS